MVTGKISMGREISDIPRPKLVGKGGLDERRGAAVRCTKVVPSHRLHGAAGWAANEAPLGEPEALVATARTSLAGGVIAVFVADVARVDVVVVVPRRWERETAVRSNATEQ